MAGVKHDTRFFKNFSKYLEVSNQGAAVRWYTFKTLVSIKFSLVLDDDSLISNRRF